MICLWPPSRRPRAQRPGEHREMFAGRAVFGPLLRHTIGERRRGTRETGEGDPGDGIDRQSKEVSLLAKDHPEVPVAKAAGEGASLNRFCFLARGNPRYVILVRFALRR